MKKQFQAPHVLVLVVVMIALAALLTWVLPAGSYNRYVDENGVTLVEDGSYQQMEQTPVGPFEMLQAIPNGLVEAASGYFSLSSAVEPTAAIHVPSMATPPTGR